MVDQSIEIIEIDDIPSSQGSTNVSVIVNGDINKPGSSNRKQRNGKINGEHYNNILFCKFIELCKSLEKSEGMCRITHRLLYKNYNSLDPEYRRSDRFKNILNTSISKLESDPRHKFSHIATLHENLKLHQYKKRVQLITLNKSLDKSSCEFNGNKSNCKNKKRKDSSVDKRRKKHKTDIINLDSEEDTVLGLVVPGVDVNDESSFPKNRIHYDEENYTSRNNRNHTDKNYKEHSINRLNGNSNIEIDNNSSRNIGFIENVSSEVDNQFILPFKNQETPILNDNKIKEIEETIEFYRYKIKLLDETEVCDNTKKSPYIQSENYKAKIVDLYKQLCDLTGCQPVQRREIRLQVIPGHPPEPVKYLEKFLNDNLAENGEPLFPDFSDVMLCVASANKQENLGWTALQIMNEANALFKQCGSALQRRRQQRDWRDMLGRVKVKEIQDPADTDRELLARLEENKRIAQKNERDVFQRFTSMETSNPQLKVLVTNDRDSSDSAEDDDDVLTWNGEPNNKSSNNVKSNYVSITENESNENANIVKLESQDISSMLEELGDDFTATIIDIEDPFMVITIPSESEDDN